jgi:glutaconate CoA-transferase subunit B
MTAELSDAARFVAVAAREIKDHQVCFVGIGIPSLAAMAAKRLHAPDMVLVYESGAIDANPPIPPLSTGSPSVVANTSSVTSCLGVFSLLQQGYLDLGLLSAAQVDRFGNLNSTVIGDYAKPKVRMVGSGGAHDIALLAKEVTLLMPHDPRRFVQAVDFATSPGIQTRETEQEGRRIRGRGPTCLVTHSARFTFETGELTLDAVADGIEKDEALEGFLWDVPISSTVRQLPPIEPKLAEIATELVESWGRAL